MKENPLVAIAGTIGGFSVAIVAVFCIFAEQYLWPAAPAIVGALVLMGIVLAYLAGRKKHGSDSTGNED